MLSEVRRLLEDTDDDDNRRGGISPIPFSKLITDPSPLTAFRATTLTQQHHQRVTTTTTTTADASATRTVHSFHPSIASTLLQGGESGASPIAMSSPSRRQTSLSPNAAYANYMAPPSQSRSGVVPSLIDNATRKGGGGGGDLDEEIKIVEMIFTTLSSSLAYYEYGGGAAATASAAPFMPSGEIATPIDAKNFVSHFNAVITYAVAHSGLQERAAVVGALGAFSAEAALIRLVFDCPFDVIQILTNLAQSAFRGAFVPPRSSHHVLPPPNEPLAHRHQPPPSFTGRGISTAADDFVQLRLASIDALKQLLNVAIEASSRKKPAGTKTSSPPSSVLGLIQTSFARCGTIKALLDVVLLPTAPEVLRVAAIETIFVFVMRCAPANPATSNGLLSLLTASFDALLKAVAMDSSSQVRCYTAAVIRQLTHLFPRHSQVVKSVPVLLRCMAQESLFDVVALCASSLDIIVRRAALELDHAAVTGGIQNVVDTSCLVLEKACGAYHVVTRLQAPSYDHDGSVKQSSTVISDDDEKQFDVLEALAGLIHACVLFALSAVSADLQAVLRTILLQGVVPRLAKLCRVQHIGCARVAAACLSVMALRAPPSFAIPQALAEPRAAVHLVHGVVSKAMPAGPISLEEDEAMLQATTSFLFDVATAVATSIVFSPLSRAHWRKLLGDLPTWEKPFVERLSAALSNAELSQFANMIILDECGTSLNDIAAVDWDDDTHPSAHSIQCLLDAQDVRGRVAKSGSLGESLSHWRSLEQGRRRPDTKRGYLCYVLLGYAFITLDTSLSASGGVAIPFIDVKQNDVRPQQLPPPTHAAASLGPRVPLEPQGSNHQNLYRPLFPHMASPVPRKSDHPNVHTSTSILAQQQPPPITADNPNTTASTSNKRAANRSTTAAAASHPHPSQNQDVYRHLYKEFQAALELTIFLSTHYHRNRLTTADITAAAGRGPNAPPHIRQTTSTLSHKKAVNPYANKQPNPNVDRAQQMRTWTSSVVVEGDLFFFYIPLTALSVTVVEAVIGKARKHQITAKKHFLITPQHQKERRWFLLDMHTTIMPKLIVLLQSLRKLIAVHSEENVRMALQVLPSVHMKRGSTKAGDADDKAITCSNLRSVCDFALQTFSIRMTSSAVDDIVGSFAGGGGGASTMMSSSFFAPLFPPAASGQGAAAADDVSEPPRRHGLFDVPPRTYSAEHSSSRGSEFADDDDDLDEMAMFEAAAAVVSGSAKQATQNSNGGYSIRRLSTGGVGAAAGRPPVPAAAPYVEDDDDDDDSFELMRL